MRRPRTERRFRSGRRMRRPYVWRAISKHGPQAPASAIGWLQIIARDHAMPSVPIVDSHLHIWHAGRFRLPGLDATPLLNRSYSVEDYRRAIQPYAVEAMVFLQCEVEPSQALDEAQWVASEAMLEPRIGGIVAWAPLEKGDAAEAD